MFNIENLGYDNITLFITTIMTIIVTLKINKTSVKNPHKIEILNIQLNNIYLPLFYKIENSLYKSISKKECIELIKFFNNIKENYFAFIDCNLIEKFKKLEKDIKNDNSFYNNYSDVCYLIDSNFEKIRQKLYLPHRTFFYKLRKHQLPTTFLIVCNTLKILFTILFNSICANIFIFLIFKLIGVIN